MATLTNAAAGRKKNHGNNNNHNNDLDIHQNRDILAEILNMSMSDLSMSVDMELQQQPQQQRSRRRQERIRRHLPLTQPQPQRKHPPAPAPPPAASQRQHQQHQQEIPSSSTPRALLQRRLIGSDAADESTCCTDLLDDEQVTAKPLLKTKNDKQNDTNTTATTSTTKPNSRSSSSLAALKSTAALGSQQRPAKSRRAASTVARATSPMQRKQQQQQQQRRFLRIFSRNKSPPPAPPSSPPRSSSVESSASSKQQPRMDQELPPLQSFSGDGSLVRSFGEVRTTDSITSLDALRRQRSLVRMSIQIRAPQFLRRPAPDPRDAMKLLKRQNKKDQQQPSPNSVLEFRAFQSNSDISKSSSIHWSQQEQDENFQDDDEERGQTDQDDHNVESSDVYDSPVGILRVHSFPYLGHALEDHEDDNVNDDEKEDEIAKVEDKQVHNGGDKVDKDQGEKEEDSPKVSYELPRSMQAVEDSKDDAKKDAPPPQQPRPIFFVTPDGFPVLDATDSTDTELASNVTVSASASIASSTASSSGFQKTTGLAKAASENGFLNSSRNMRAAIHPRFRQPPFTNKASQSSPQSDKMMYQLWGNVTQRVSGLSIDAGNLLKPIHACTSPPVDHFLVDDNGDYYSNSHGSSTTPNQHHNSTSKRVMLSCTSGCTALGQEFGAFEEPPSTGQQPLGSTPAGFQAMYSTNSEYATDRSPRQRTRDPQTLRRSPRGSTIEEEEDECPSTEVTLEVTYPTTSQTNTNSGVMALGEQCDTTRGEVVVKVAMLSQREASPVTSLNRKRQIVSAAKRWSAHQQKSDLSPAPEQALVVDSSPAEEASVVVDATASVEELTPVLLSCCSDNDNTDAYAQLPCQPVLSSIVPHNTPPTPPSSLSNTSRNTSRWLPPRPSEPVLCSTPSLLGSSEDEECEGEDAAVAEAPQEEEEGDCHPNNPTPTAAEGVPTASQQYRKGVRISPVSVTELRDAV